MLLAAPGALELLLEALVQVAVVVEAGEAVGDGLDLGPAEADGGRLQHRRQGVRAVACSVRSSDSTAGASTVTAATTAPVASRTGAMPDTQTPKSSAFRTLASRLSPASTRASSSSASQGSPQCETSSLGLAGVEHGDALVAGHGEAS